MLTELRIQNFAIIDEISLNLQPGLIILTGETGAGKSIVLDAVELLLGSRADSGQLRSGARRAYIEGLFRLQGSARAAVHVILQRESLLDDPDELILAREVRANGRSIARVNGRTVSVALLREIGAHLVDIHGQSEHLSLLVPRRHLNLLDRFAHNQALLEDYRQTYRKLSATRNQLHALRTARREAARRADLLAYQIEEIETANLRPGEEETLRQERDRLANAEALSLHAREAVALLDEGTPESPAAADLLGQAVRALQQLSRYDPSQQPLLQNLELLLENLSEVTRTLRDYQETVEYNPVRLSEIEERLDLIRRLKRKYGDTIAEILAYAEEIRAELDDLTHAEERLDALQAEERTLLQTLAQKAAALSRQRKQAAQALAAGVEKELADLRMEQARFQVQINTHTAPDGLPQPQGEPLAFGPHGVDEVQFLIAPNPGEGLKPMAKIASGGETSRLMLALKNVLAQADETPTLVFDEIDQGIGGRIGLTVGHKLWQLARHHQVICVTHLPQLAAFGDQHLRVEKQVQDGRTHTRIVPLDDEERLLELAQMLGGIGESTLNSAHDLWQNARRQMQQS